MKVLLLGFSALHQEQIYPLPSRYDIKSLMEEMENFILTEKGKEMLNNDLVRSTGILKGMR
jgi:hypothetical protein